jgi:glycerol uptake facilitator protein
MSIYFAEFIGTLLVILLGGGIVAGAVLKGTKSENAGWASIAISWGLAVTFAIYAVGSISGAHMNPAVTIGLAFGGDFPWKDVPGYAVAQLLGAFTGATLVWIFYSPHWAITEDAEAKRAVFCTSPAIRSYANNFFDEMLATAVLLFALNFIGTDFSSGLKPLVVGALVMIIGFSLGGTTGYAINPARDLGPRLAHFLMPIRGKGSSDWSYAWVPILGPLLGCLLGTALFRMMFKGDFQTQYWVVIIIAIAVTIVAVIKGQKYTEQG